MMPLIFLSAASAEKDDEQVKKEKQEDADRYYERCMSETKCEQTDEKALKTCKVQRALKCLAPEKEEE